MSAPQHAPDHDSGAGAGSSAPAGERAIGGSVRSVNIASRAQQLPGLGRPTGIGKHPVVQAVQVSAPGPKGVGASGLAGDLVSDLRYHGGNDQAVYAYAAEDLDWWSATLGRELADGLFGENLTTVGIDISSALVGETWQLGGELVLQVSDPRLPCRTFAAAIGERHWIKRFTERGAPGTYLRVLRAGPVQAGDPIQVLSRPEHDVTVAQAFRAYTTDPGQLPRLIGIDGPSAAAAASTRKRTQGRDPR